MSKLITYKLSRRFIKATFVAAVPLFLFACADEPKKDRGEAVQAKKEKREKKDVHLLEMDGKVFSIPSPIQTAFLLKNSGTAYSSELLNNPASVSNYTTTEKKALNLGVYGADLGYATIYNQTQDAVSFMTTTKRISSELGMSTLFSQSMLSRFESNLGNQDSLLSLVSDAFQSADSYLKNNEQNNLSALILAGGWVETLHFATNLAGSTDSKAIKTRIGEQKITIKNLVNLLLPFQEKKMAGELINKLNELKDLYDGIEFTYTYVEPEVDEENRTTTINSESKINMTPEQLKDISAKVNEIRNSIIN